MTSTGTPERRERGVRDVVGPAVAGWDRFWLVGTGGVGIAIVWARIPPRYRAVATALGTVKRKSTIRPSPGRSRKVVVRSVIQAPTSLRGASGGR